MSRRILDLHQPPHPQEGIGEKSEVSHDIVSSSALSPSNRPTAHSLTTPTAPTNFLQFPSLPVEIRVSIWELLLPGPRVVEVIYNKKTRRTFSPTPPPTLLSTCSESRQEALRKFKLLFYLKSTTRPIYINTTVDTLFLSTPQEPLKENHAFHEFDFPTNGSTYLETLLHWLHFPVARDIKYIALDSAMFNGRASSADERFAQVRTILKFKNLKHLSLMMCEYIETGTNLHNNLQFINPVEARCMRHISDRSVDKSFDLNCAKCLVLDQEIVESIWPEYDFAGCYSNFKDSLKEGVESLSGRDKYWNVPEAEVMTLMRWE